MKTQNFKILLLAFALVFVKLSYAQKHVQLINSQTILKEGIELYDQGKYQKALDLYAKVPNGDTNYYSAQYELSLCYYALEKYEQVVNLSRKLIADGSYEVNQFNILGNALDELKRTDEAIAAYNEGLKKYPFNSNLLLNKAIVYESSGDFKKAFEVYKELFNVSPLYPSAHLHMAQMAEKEGRLTQAIMAYTFFFILEPTTARSKRVLADFNNLCNKSSNSIATTSTGVFTNEFEEIDFLVSNQVALNSKYKIPGKMKFPLNRQLYLVLEKTAGMVQNDAGFFSKYYLPFFSDFLKTQSFENLSLLVLASSDNEDIAKVVNKNVENLKKSRTAYIEKMAEIRPTREFELNGNKLTLKYWSYDNFTTEALGNRNSLNKNIGTWVSFGKDGFLDMIGGFNEKGNRTGNWYFFNELGDTTKILTYKDGIANGPYKIFRQGKVYEVGTYVNDVIKGEVLNYYPDGTLQSKDSYENDKRNGVGTQYFANGKIRYEYTSANGELVGVFKEYYSNGLIKQECNYKNGKYDGIYKEFYENGKPKLDCKYVNNILEGPYKTYHSNGSIEKEGIAVKGNISGKWITYYSDGKVKVVSNMDESGKVNGEEEYYTPNGKKYGQDTYVKGDWRNVKYFGVDGKIIFETKISKSGTKLTNYDYHFDKMSEGVLTAGKREGLWNFYYSNGTISTTENYSKGDLQGECKTYYTNGELAGVYNYDANEKDGLELKYHVNGNLSSEGNYVGGYKCGVWRTYHVNGALDGEYFYNVGDLNGWGVDYFSNGKAYKKFRYKEGVLVEIQHCDTNGMVLDSIKLPNGNGRVVLKSASGKKGYDGGFLNGYTHGKVSWFYPSGQISVKGEYYLGYRNGEYLSYHPNGKLSKKQNYYYGDIHVVSEFYNYFGEVTQKDEYRYGINHGKNIFYYRNGKVETEVGIYEDEKHGECRYFATTGELREIRFYDFGKLIGYTYMGKNGKLLDTIFTKGGDAVVKAYYQNGTLATEYEVKGGKYEGSYKIYHPNGKLQEERFYAAGNEIKPTMEYFNTGEVLRIQNYLAGELHGATIEYNTNGTPRLKENFVNGNLEGLCEYFDTTGKRTNAYYYMGDEIIAVIQ